ncbi:MAG: phosphotransferase [Actinomycetota bacterium]
MITPELPTEERAVGIAERFLGEAVASCDRFATGLRNWVYDVTGISGASIVVRMCDPRHREELAGGRYWTSILAAAGVPVAAVLASDVEAAHPFLILERLNGADLGTVITSLSAPQRRSIATDVADAQRRVGRLGVGPGFGYSVNGVTGLVASWAAVIESEVDTWDRHIAQAGVVSPAWVGRARQALFTISDQLDGIGPRPFLHDATTKNVIVADGKLQGIVDVDTMGFGDVRWAVALTRMSLIAADQPTDYIDALMEHLMPAEDPRIVSVYTALHGVGFLAELGQRFNRPDRAPVVDDKARIRLEHTVDQLLASVGGGRLSRSPQR